MKYISKIEFEHLPHETVVYACIRNENERLPYFLNYHKNLGIDKFVILDNDSTDGSTDYLLSRDDCYVYWTDDSYSASNCGIEWMNSLLNQLSMNRWVLVLDADELFIYPNCENSSINKLTQNLVKNNANAFQTFLLDMYAKGPLKDAEYLRGQNFIDVCSFFDTDSYHKKPNTYNQHIPSRGGPRKRLFWQNPTKQTGKPPVLKKIPLIKWSDKLKLEASTHILKNATFSKKTGALLHFKLFSDFYNNAEKESKRGEHWDNAAQYSSYWSVLSQNPDLDPFYEGSVQYQDSLQLLKLGLIFDD